MRLIDEDAVMEMLTNIELSCSSIPMIEAKTRLRDIPTAYDVDKVVEQVEEYLFERYCIEGDSKIDEIVKEGGANE